MSDLLSIITREILIIWVTILGFVLFSEYHSPKNLCWVLCQKISGSVSRKIRINRVTILGNVWFSKYRYSGNQYHPLENQKRNFVANSDLIWRVILAFLHVFTFQYCYLETRISWVTILRNVCFLSIVLRKSSSTE